ncbi:MAG: hypothetical protein ACKVWV_09745 [Planctomycetota bacterium]
MIIPGDGRPPLARVAREHDFAPAFLTVLRPHRKHDDSACGDRMVVEAGK